MNLVSQEKVINWIKAQESGIHITPKGKSPKDNKGPDLCLEIDNLKYYFEAIAFSVPGGKNQMDFWKAFSQAISRLNPDSKWGNPDKIIIALPYDYKKGWETRLRNYGRDIWYRIGKAFPELEIWFVSSNKIDKYPWNDSFYM